MSFLPLLFRLLVRSAYLFPAVLLAADVPLELTWPTSGTAWMRGKSFEAFAQHAGSGDPESGTFGGVRSAGQQFHEGLDIRSEARDRRGQPLDEIRAALDGVVRHVARNPGESSYGRYLVLEHPDHSPAVYTLYAHLARVAPDVRPGSTVRRGHVLGVMGNSADKPFPRERAHLHFELGLMVTQNFQRWYDRRKFGSRNEQGVWNGMNLMGVDPLWVFDGWRQGRVRTMADVFRNVPPAVRLRIATHQSPDFIRRYPSLLTRPLPMGPVAGWEITFGWTGLPFAWTPLTAMEVAGLAREKPIVTWVDAALERRERSKTLVVSRRGQWHTAKDLDTVLQQLFGLK